MDKDRQKAFKRAARSIEDRALRDAMPVAPPQARALFDFIELELETAGPSVLEACDHTLRLAANWCRLNSFDEAPILDWLRESGGCRDCEVLLNVADRVTEATARAGRS